MDDILNDLDMELTDENRRAVRILGYNSIEITQDSVFQMKAADEEVQRVFKNMTPAVVTQMIKRGINPLEMDFTSLNQEAENIKSEESVGRITADSVNISGKWNRITKSVRRSEALI